LYGGFIVGWGVVGEVVWYWRLWGDGSSAPSPAGINVDGSPVPLGSTATHDPIEITKALWARWKSLETTPKQ